MQTMNYEAPAVEDRTEVSVPLDVYQSSSEPSTELTSPTWRTRQGKD